MNAARDVALIVIAKSPVPGRSKTRLTPPCSPEQAAALAQAALADTLDAVALTPAARRVLVLEGSVGPWFPGGFQVVRQRGDGLDERLAAAFQDVGGPALLIGMDTPQVHRILLEASMLRLLDEGVDAVLGDAGDGGFWSIGLRESDPSFFVGVPMGAPTTGAQQRERLEHHGLRVAALPILRDVDRFDDAASVASLIPRSRFASTLAQTRTALGATA